MPPRLPSRRPSPEHQDALQRRLGLLGDPIRRDDNDPEWEAERSADTVAGSPVPDPGRHASRRPGARMRELIDTTLPEPLRGRVHVGAAQLTVVVLVVAVGLAVTCWWLVRSHPDQLRAPLPTVEPAVESGFVTTTPAPADAVAAPGTGPPTAASARASPGGSAAAPGSAPRSAPSSAIGSTTGSVTVDVAGKVRRPGIVVLQAGARVVDAITAAGGARRGVDLTPLNLARVLVDGEQVLVGLAGGAGPPAGAQPGGPAGTSAPAAPIDLNSATQEQLEALPEVGPVTAAAILAWRETHGRFTAVEELLEVDGIGDATLAQLAPYVRV